MESHISKLFNGIYQKLHARSLLLRTSQTILNKHGISLRESDLTISGKEMKITGSRVLKQELFIKNEKILKEINTEVGSEALNKIS